MNLDHCVVDIGTVVVVVVARKKERCQVSVGREL